MWRQMFKNSKSVILQNIMEANRIKEAMNI